MSGRWLLLALLCGLLTGLSACAHPEHPAEGTEGRLAETDESAALHRARLHTELASRYFDNGQMAVALDEIGRALAADPNHGPAHVLRGLAQMRLSNERLAEDSFVRALQINPRDRDALHNQGWLQCQQGRHAQSLVSFARALALADPDGHAKTWMTQGICQVRSGLLTDAETSFLRAHQLDADHPVVGYNLADLLYRRGELQRAQSYIQRLNQSEFANAQSLWLGLRVERRLQNTQTMDQLSRRLGQRFADSPEWALYQRGAFDE
jgi:type IV pilus assembly protein PilF